MQQDSLEIKVTMMQIFQATFQDRREMERRYRDGLVIQDERIEVAQLTSIPPAETV